MNFSLEGLPVFVEVFWKSGVALGAGLCISSLLREKSADLRRLVLSTSVVAMFVAAVSLPALPRWSAILPDWIQLESRTVPVAAAPSSEFWIQRSLGIGGGVALSRAEPVKSNPQVPSRIWLPNQMPGPIPLIWGFGSLLLLARFAVSLLGLRRLRSASQAMASVDLHSHGVDLHSHGVYLHSHGIALLQNEAISAPVTWGIFRPVILVPARFAELPGESRDAVLCHELAHIQRHDFLLRVLAEIARALIWFQPLMWIARRQLRVEQELACDNRVLVSGGRPSMYAKLLMDWAEPTPVNDALLAVGMAHPGNLKRRLFAVLDRDLPRDTVSAMGVLAICVAGLATALPLAAISFTHAIPAPPSAPRTMQIMPSAPVPAASAPRVQLAQTQRAPAPVQSPGPQAIATDAGALPKFSTTVALVIMDVTVTDKSGRNREDLKAGDFAITEDGVPQNISVFEFQKLDDAPQGVGSYYILAYYPTNFNEDGSYRKIRTTLRDDVTSRLDFRIGYYAGKRFDRFGAPDEAPVQFDIAPPRSVYMVDGVTCRGCDNTVGPGVTFPVLISQKQPQYSEEARKAKYSGIVTLNVGVDASGQVTDIKVAKSLGMGLDEKATEAVTQWKFKPGMQNGQPVTARVQVDVNFRLL